MGSSRDKWIVRAQKYSELLRTKGHAEATDYLMRFGDKSEKVIEALRELQEVREEMEEDYQGRLQMLKKAVQKENEILGTGDRIPDSEGD